MVVMYLIWRRPPSLSLRLSLGQLAQLAQLARPVPPDPEADLDPQDLAELPVMQAPQVLRAPKALRVPLARTERLAPPVLLGLSVLPVGAVIWLLLLSS